jgi:hypothetical protein
MPCTIYSDCQKSFPDGWAAALRRPRAVQARNASNPQPAERGLGHRSAMTLPNVGDDFWQSVYAGCRCLLGEARDFECINGFRAATFSSSCDEDAGFTRAVDCSFNSSEGIDLLQP